MPLVPALDVLEAELRKRLVPFQRTDDPLVYQVKVAGSIRSVSLFNVERDYRRDEDPAHVLALVEQLLAPAGLESAWSQAQSHVYFALEAADQELSGLLVSRVSDRAVRVLVETDVNFARLSMVTSGDLKRWSVDRPTVESAALRNLDSLLEGIAPEISDIDGLKLGMIPIEPPFKASVVLAPSFKAFAMRSLGWPILAVIPARDFVYIFAETDRALLNRIGGVVMQEFEESGYPISPEVYRISDEGIEAIGSFDG